MSWCSGRVRHDGDKEKKVGSRLRTCACLTTHVRKARRRQGSKEEGNGGWWCSRDEFGDERGQLVVDDAIGNREDDMGIVAVPIEKEPKGCHDHDQKTEAGGWWHGREER